MGGWTSWHNFRPLVHFVSCFMGVLSTSGGAVNHPTVQDVHNQGAMYWQSERLSDWWLDASPLEEPPIDLFYGDLGERARPIPRLTDAHPEDVVAHIRSGIPVILTDVGRQDWPMHDWSCARVSELFPGERMKREYKGGADADVKEQTMGDASWHNKKVSIENGNASAPGPKCAPYYWQTYSNPGSAAATRVRHATRLPYAVVETDRNTQRLNGTNEFWFSRSCAGAKAHVDEHVESTMSITLDGNKLWRLSVIPPQHVIPFYHAGFDEHAFFLDGENPEVGELLSQFGDDAIDVAKWSPLWEGYVGSGEALLFPPSLIHDTVAVGDGCHSSVTFQWGFPVATSYLRAFLPRLAMTEEMGNSNIGKWAPLFTLAPFNADEARPWYDVQPATVSFDAIDANADRKISLDELKAWFSYSAMWTASDCSDKDRQPAPPSTVYIGGEGGFCSVVGASEEHRAVSAVDAFHLHDLNQDGSIEPDEFMWTIARYEAVRQTRNNATKTFTSRWKRWSKKWGHSAKRRQCSHAKAKLLDGVRPKGGDIFVRRRMALEKTPPKCERFAREWLAVLQAAVVKPTPRKKKYVHGREAAFRARARGDGIKDSHGMLAVVCISVVGMGLLLFVRRQRYRIVKQRESV